jgi:hypothetical protein
MPRDLELNTIIALAGKIGRRLPKKMLKDRLITLRDAINEWLAQN